MVVLVLARRCGGLACTAPLLCWWPGRAGLSVSAASGFAVCVLAVMVVSGA